MGSLKTTFQNMGTTFHKQSVMETRSLALHEHNNKLLRDVHARNYHGDFREMEGSPKWNSGVSQCFFSGFAEDFPIPSVAKVDLSSTSQNSRMGMRNPVIAADGHQYERESIEEYIQHRLEKGLELRSPVTNEVLAHTVLTPVRQPANYAPMTSSMMPSGRLSNTVSPSATSNLGLKIILTSQGGLLSANV